MKLWDKIVKGVNPDDDEPFNETFEDDEIYGGMSDGNGNMGDMGDIGDYGMSGGGYSPYGNGNQNQGGGYSQTQTQQNYQQAPPPSNSGSGLSVSGGGNMQLSVELKVVKPETFEEVREIAEHLIGRKTVVLNLEDTNKETARRLLDFLAGVAYTIQGQIERVSERTFVITPSNILISAGQIKEEHKKINNTDTSIY